MTDLTMYRGDDRDFTITATEDGSPLDLTGATVRFTAKRDAVDADDAAVIAKTSDTGIAIDEDPTTGVAVITIEAADTEDLRASATLVYDVQVTRGGRTLTVLAGHLAVIADVSRTAP